MNLPKELLPGAFQIPLGQFSDIRGVFVKTYLASALAKFGITFELREEFYSVSSKNVIRGMHFHLPPHDHEKIVYCPAGEALDVLLDLRVGPHFGKARTVILAPEEPSIIFIPKGVAHGFKALQDDTLMIYKTSAEYTPSHDCGIRFDTFGFNWECDNPILSGRDLSHPSLGDFVSPFLCQ